MNDKIATLAENAVGKNRTQVNCSGTYETCIAWVDTYAEKHMNKYL